MTDKWIKDEWWDEPKAPSPEPDPEPEPYIGEGIKPSLMQQLVADDPDLKRWYNKEIRRG